MNARKTVVTYDREKDLNRRLNSFFEGNLGLPKDDYCSRLDFDGFLGLKSVLSDINNILTLKVALAFTRWITGRLGLDQDAANMIESRIRATKPNANGYDIELSIPVKLIAEVKCNVPIHGGKVYGSAQKNGIAKDIEALISGKRKSSVVPRDCFKFMVFLDKPEIREATEHLVRNMKKGKELISFVDNESKITSTENIYLTFVEI